MTQAEKAEKIAKLRRMARIASPANRGFFYRELEKLEGKDRKIGDVPAEWFPKRATVDTDLNRMIEGVAK